MAKSKIETFKEKLEYMIKREGWYKGKKLPSTRDLAKEYDVSYVTACKVLAELHNEGILERRNGVGTFVAYNSDSCLKINKIGVPLRVEKNPFFAALYEKISETANKLGIQIIFGDATNMDEAKFIERLAREGCKNMIRFAAGAIAEPTLQNVLKKNGMRTVIINDWWFNGGGFPCVRSDEETAVCELLDYLYMEGHRHIALLDDVFRDTRINAQKAFMQWHWKHKIAPVPEQFFFFWDDKTHKHLYKMPENGMSAVLCLFDILAFNLMDIFSEKGISTPKDISIVGMDGVSTSFNNGLTAMQQDIDALVEKSFQILLSNTYGNTDIVKVKCKLCQGKNC